MESTSQDQFPFLTIKCINESLSDLNKTRESITKAIKESYEVRDKIDDQIRLLVRIACELQGEVKK